MARETKREKGRLRGLRACNKANRGGQEGEDRVGRQDKVRGRSTRACDMLRRGRLEEKREGRREEKLEGGEKEGEQRVGRLTKGK